MGIAKDLTGQRFGRLTVIRKDGLSKRHYTNYLCQCDCGNTISADSGRLRQGQVKDCGNCWDKSGMCRFNTGVLCGQPDCGKCGWNPDVERIRKDAL